MKKVIISLIWAISLVLTNCTLKAAELAELSFLMNGIQNMFPRVDLRPGHKLAFEDYMRFLKVEKLKLEMFANRSYSNLSMKANVRLIEGKSILVSYQTAQVFWYLTPQALAEVAENPSNFYFTGRHFAPVDQGKIVDTYMTWNFPTAEEVTRIFLDSYRSLLPGVETPTLEMFSSQGRANLAAILSNKDKEKLKGRIVAERLFVEENASPRTIGNALMGYNKPIVVNASKKDLLRFENFKGKETFGDAVLTRLKSKKIERDLAKESDKFFERHEISRIVVTSWQEISKTLTAEDFSSVGLDELLDRIRQVAETIKRKNEKAKKDQEIAIAAAAEKALLEQLACEENNRKSKGEKKKQATVQGDEKNKNDIASVQSTAPVQSAALFKLPPAKFLTRLNSEIQGYPFEHISLHRRLLRWDTNDQDKVRGFVDWDSNARQPKRPYEMLPVSELDYQRGRHAIQKPLLDLVTSETFMKNYAFPYFFTKKITEDGDVTTICRKGIAMHASMIHGKDDAGKEKQYDGYIRIALDDDNVVFHATFDREVGPPSLANLIQGPLEETWENRDNVDDDATNGAATTALTMTPMQIEGEFNLVATVKNKKNIFVKFVIHPIDAKNMTLSTLPSY